MTVQFSDKLKADLREKSHAMLEDNLTYDDEGGDQSMWDSTTVFNIVLDHLDSESSQEYRDLVRVHGAQAVEDEGIKHVYEN